MMELDLKERQIRGRSVYWTQQGNELIWHVESLGITEKVDIRDLEEGVEAHMLARILEEEDGPNDSWAS